MWSQLFFFYGDEAQTCSPPEAKQVLTRPDPTRCENTFIIHPHNPSCANQMITPYQENLEFSANC